MYAPYVATLFQFLETRGVSQADIARELDLSRTSTNFWAKGSRPISRGYAWRFGTLVYDHLSQLGIEAWDVVGPWDNELAHQNGLMDTQAQEAAKLISELILMGPSKLRTAQLQDYYLAAKRMEAALGSLIRRRGETPSGDVDRHWLSFEDPLERYKQLWRACGIDLDQPEPARQGDHAA